MHHSLDANFGRQFPTPRPQQSNCTSAVSSRSRALNGSNRNLMFAIRSLRCKRLKSPNLALRSLPYFEKQTRAYSPNDTTEELNYPPGSTSHNDIRSFLEYAARTNVDESSTVYVGTHYEYTVQAALEGLGMSLKRIGGKSDYGIDILGTWSLPSLPHPLRVLVQCKGNAKKLLPAQARELEGAFVGAPQGWRGPSILAFLVSPNAATKGMREALSRSKLPVGYVCCSREGRISQIMWNRRAEEEGLEDVGVGLRYTGSDPRQKEVILTWGQDVLND